MDLEHGAAEQHHPGVPRFGGMTVPDPEFAADDGSPDPAKASQTLFFAAMQARGERSDYDRISGELAGLPQQLLAVKQAFEPRADALARAIAADGWHIITGSGAAWPEAYYYGIRRFPYSTDTSKNGLTFKHIQPAFVLPGTAAFGQDGADNDVDGADSLIWQRGLGLTGQPDATTGDATIGEVNVQPGARLVMVGSGEHGPGLATVLSLAASESGQLTIGAGASVVFDGVILQVNGLMAATGSKVTIRRSLIQSLQVGATFDGSTVTLDRDTITENLSGLVFKSSTVSITNSFFLRNTPAPGQPLIDLTGGSGVFQLNTVAYNGLGAPAPVLGCSGSSAVMVKNSIFAMNGVTQQLGTACRTVPSSLVLGSSDPTTGQIKKDPVFESPQTNDLRLKPRDATNLQFLIDKAVAADASDKNPDHDYFGTPRPQGAAADIGAFEALP